jgi:thymidylate synthase ThyX
MINHTTARVIAKSYSSTTGIELTTFELEYPRIVHEQLLTHRQFSRNSSSSRAVPTAKMVAHIREFPGVPIFWGKNKSGMSAKEELPDSVKEEALAIWQEAIEANIGFAERLSSIGVHKQIANRPVDTYSTIKVIVSATEFANFYHLRLHEDAQPEIRVLAEAMRDASASVVAQVLRPGEWHLPYINTIIDGDTVAYQDTLGTVLTLEDAKIISASCCAQVSYRTTDFSIEKARIIYNKLVKEDIIHGSSVEHLATPMSAEDQPGITHMTRNSDLYSGNFRGWIQFRKLLAGESK